MLDYILRTIFCMVHESIHEAIVLAVMVHVAKVVREVEVLIPTVEVVKSYSVVSDCPRLICVHEHCNTSPIIYAVL